MRKIRLKLEELGVESFVTAAAAFPRGTVRGNRLAAGIESGYDCPDETVPAEPETDWPGGSGFNSCQTCIINTCGTCPDQV